MQEGTKYLVLLQIDAIQTFLFEYLSKETNKQTLAKAKANSNLVGKITKLNKDNKDDLGLKFQFRKSLFSDITLTGEKIVMDISGKCVVILTESEKKDLEEKLQKTEREYTRAGITLTYLFEEIINSDEEKAYNRLIEKSQTPKKQNLLLSLSEFPYEKLFLEVDEEKDTQTTKQVLEKYCQNYSENKRENNRSEELQNLNQIAIIKADLNNIGANFKYNDDLKEKSKTFNALKEKSNTFEQAIQSFAKFSENKIFSLYVAGDDIFIISRIDQIQEVLTHIQIELKKINKEFGSKLTIAIAVLTTDYRSTFRYYLEKVEELLKQAKQDKTKDVVNMNGMILTLNECIDFFDMYKVQNTLDETKILHSRSKLHNTLEIIKGDAPFEIKKLNAMYMLSKDGVHKIYKQLFEEIENTKKQHQVIQIKTKIQNILLLSKYMDVEAATEEEFESCLIDYEPKIQDVLLLNGDTNIIELWNDGKKVNLQLKSYVKDVQNKGFWFRLNELILIEKEEERKKQLTKFFLNYQYHNQKVIRYDFQTNQDEDNYRYGCDEKHRENRTKIRNYKQCEAKEMKEVQVAINKRNTFIKSVVQEMIDKSCRYQCLCRERIIEINIKKQEQYIENRKDN